MEKLNIGPFLFTGSILLVRSLSNYYKSSLKDKTIKNITSFSTSISSLPITTTITPATSTNSNILKNSIIQSPNAKQIHEDIYFGINPKNPSEYRGKNLMNPPIIRSDKYNWLRDETRSKPEVLEQIEAENKYCKDILSPLNNLNETLYQEMLSYLKETDDEVPYRDGPYYYYTKNIQGLSYKIHCRKVDLNSEEEIILDENKLAVDHDYCVVDSVEPSPSHEILAYTVDYTGNETYDIYFTNIKTGEIIDTITGCGGSVDWGTDDSTIFYTKLDSELRQFQIWLHTIGSNQSNDILIFEDLDKLFSVYMYKSSSKQYFFITTQSIETHETSFISLKGVNGAESHRNAVLQRTIIQPKTLGLRYSVEHHESYFYILTNLHESHNFKLMRIPIQSSNYSTENWNEVTSYQSNRELTDLLVFKSGIIIFGRENGSQKIWSILTDSIKNNLDSSTSSLSLNMSLDSSIIFVNSLNIPENPKWNEIEFQETCYSVWSKNNVEYDTSILRIGYSSFITPRSVIDVNFHTNDQNILKVNEVPNYQSENYIVRRIYAKSNHSDDVLIPISLVFHRSLIDNPNDENELPNNRPVLLYGYGSYGICINPSFDYKRLPLLNRGIIYAIAHIRGGGEMGRYQWYEAGGKYLTKMNTFYDFKDSALHLIQNNVTSPNQLAIVGRSAGGLLIGATINLFPQYFKAAVADVPFVDVVNTMSDPTIPLTVGEWEEWGNPNEKLYYDYMSQYCPYTNVKSQAYPSLLITAGLHDPRVAYWEPLKWINKLREYKTDSNLLLLEIDTSSGHFSASDRYKELRHQAFEMSFVINQITGEGGPIGK